MQVLQDLMVRLLGDGSGYSKMLDKAAAHTKAATAAIGRNAYRVMGFTSAVAGFMASARIAKGLFGITNAFGKFDLEMARSLAILDEVTDEMRTNMEELAKDITTKSITSADQLASSYYHMASAGLSAAQSMAILAQTEKFAVAGNFDMKKATDLLVDVMGSLDLKSQDTEEIMANVIEVTDGITRGQQLANVSTLELAESLTKFAPAMKTYNISLKDGIALLDVYAERAGLRGVTAGNAAMRMVQLLTKAAIKSQDLSKIIYNASGNFRDFADIFEDINKAVEGKSTQDIAKQMSKFGFEVRIQKIVLPMLKATGLVRHFREELDKMGGTTERVANKQLQAFSNQITILKNQLTVLAIEVGKIFVPVILKVNKVISDGIKWFRGLSDEWKEFIAWTTMATAIIAVIAPMIALLGPLFLAAFAPLAVVGGIVIELMHVSTWMLVAVTGVKLLTRAFWTLINPILLLAALWKTFKFVMFGPEMMIVFAILKIVAVLAVLIHQAGGFKQALQIVKQALIDFWKWLEPVRKALDSLLRTGWKKLTELVFEIGDHMIKMIKEFVEWLGIDWESLWENVRSGAVDALIFMEYTLEHLPQIAQLAFAAAKYHALVFANVLAHFFSVQLPYMLYYFQRQVPIAIMMVYDWIVQATYKLIGNIFTAIKAGGQGINWFDLLKGYWRANLLLFGNIVNLWIQLPQQIAKGAFITGEMLGRAFVKVTKNLAMEEAIQAQNARNLLRERLKMPPIPTRKFERFRLPDRIPTDLERKWKEEYEKIGNAIGQSFAAFRQMKLDEWAKQHGTEIGKAFSTVAKEAKEAGKSTGNNFVGEFAKSMKKIDAVLVGTAEDFEKLEEYRLALAGDRLGVDMADNGMGPGGMVPDDPGGGNGGGDHWDKMLDVLKDIKDNTDNDGGGFNLDFQGV